jgi:hypothetical protein
LDCDGLYVRDKLRLSRGAKQSKVQSKVRHSFARAIQAKEESFVQAFQAKEGGDLMSMDEIASSRASPPPRNDGKE